MFKSVFKKGRSRAVVAAFALTALFFSACQKTPAEQLVGSWQFVGGVYQRPEGDTSNKELVERQKMFINNIKLAGMAGQSYHFGADGSWQRRQNGRQDDGVWAAPKPDEIKLMMGEAEANWNLTRVKDDSLFVVERDGVCYTELVFVRQKE